MSKNKRKEVYTFKVFHKNCVAIVQTTDPKAKLQLYTNPGTQEVI